MKKLKASDFTVENSENMHVLWRYQNNRGLKITIERSKFTYQVSGYKIIGKGKFETLGAEVVLGMENAIHSANQFYTNFYKEKNGK